MKKVKSILLFFSVWRMFLFLPLALGFLFLPYRPSFEFTNIFSRINPYSPVNSFLLYPWANFDGVNYLSIAGNGYSLDGRYFPLFPLLINLFSRLLGDTTAFGLTQFFTGLIFSNIAFFLALIFFYKLIRLDYSEGIAKWALIILLAFPTSFFFAGIYSEGLFLLLTVLAFYFARKEQWFLASLCGILLSATRSVGILILPALFIEYLIQERKVPLSKIAYLLVIPAGLLSFAYFNLQKWGNALYFIQNQGTLDNGRSTASLILFPQTIIRYFKIFATVPISQYEWWIALLELGMFLGVSYLLFRAWQEKVRLSYLIFAYLAFLVPISSGTFTGLPRYAIILFPIYLTLAKLPNKVKYIYLGFSLSLLFVLLMLFARGYYIA